METEIAKLVMAVLYALAAAFVYAILGYYKREDVEESFDPAKFITTLLVAVIAGVFSYVLKLTPKEIVTFILNEGFIIVVLESAGKAIYRRLVKPIMGST